MAAFVHEKFARALPGHNMDALVDNIMTYYLPNAYTTSARLYAELMSKRQSNYEMMRVPTSVPTGCVRFKNDIGHMIDWQLRDKYTNLIHSTWYEVGGHFAALEVPELLYNDFIQFVRKIKIKYY